MLDRGGFSNRVQGNRNHDEPTNVRKRARVLKENCQPAFLSFQDKKGI